MSSSIGKLVKDYKLRKSQEDIRVEKQEAKLDTKEKQEAIKSYTVPQQQQTETPKKPRGRPPSKSPSRLTAIPEMIQQQPRTTNAMEAANRLKATHYIQEIQMYRIHFGFIIGPALENIALPACSPEELKALAEGCEAAIENYIVSHSTPLLLDDIIGVGEKVITGIALTSDNPNVQQLSFLQNFAENCKKDPILDMEMKLTACKWAKYMPRSRPMRILSSLARVGIKTYTDNKALAKFEHKVENNDKFKDF